jgi:hypothetical protein
MGRARVVLRSALPFLIAAPALAVVQELVPPEYWLLLTTLGVNVILAVSLNVVNGFTGQFSIGHAGFMAVGAYTAAKITLALASASVAGLPPAVSEQLVFAFALVCGMATAAVAGLAVGLPSLRLRGDYLAIVTLGFGEIIRVVIENTRALGQATGIPGLPPLTNLVWVGLGAIATVAMARRLAGSSHGRALLAIREDEIAAEAALDGIYVIRTSLSKQQMSAPDTVRSYKALSEVERAFRSLKTVDLEVRPIHHRLADRVRAHIFLCMLAYYVEWHMREAWRPLLFADEDQQAKKIRDPVAPARRSEAADAKAATHELPDGTPAHSFQSLLGELATIVRNTCRTRGNNDDSPTFTIVTTPSPAQRRALSLLEEIAA